MSEQDRITEFGFKDIKLLNGAIIRVRPLTFKEKKEYLAFLTTFENLKDDNLATGYINVQTEVAWFIIKLFSPDVTKEVVEENVNGDILKQLLDVAFYDPFAASFGMMGK